MIPSDFSKDFKEKKALIREFKELYSDKEDKLNSLRLNSLVGDAVRMRPFNTAELCLLISEGLR